MRSFFLMLLSIGLTSVRAADHNESLIADLLAPGFENIEKHPNPVWLDTVLGQQGYDKVRLPLRWRLVDALESVGGAYGKEVEIAQQLMAMTYWEYDVPEKAFACLPTSFAEDTTEPIAKLSQRQLSYLAAFVDRGLLVRLNLRARPLAPTTDEQVKYLAQAYPNIASEKYSGKTLPALVFLPSKATTPDQWSQLDLKRLTSEFLQMLRARQNYLRVISIFNRA